MIKETEILQITKEVCEIFDYKCIITGSIADYFNLDFKEIEDIDIVVNSTFYYSIYKNLPFKNNTYLQHKTNKNIIHRCYINNTKLDIFIKKENDIDQNINVKYIIVNNKTYQVLVFGHNARYKELNNYYSSHKTVTKTKQNKVSKRLEIYRNILDKQNDSNSM